MGLAYGALPILALVPARVRRTCPQLQDAHWDRCPFLIACLFAILVLFVVKERQQCRSFCVSRYNVSDMAFTASQVRWRVAS